MGGKLVTNRKKRRMPCELRVDSRTHSGLVLDLSPSGLFIQTNAKARAGQPIDILISTGTGEPIPLQVEVVRKKLVPPRLLTVTGGGVGVRILHATEAYFAFLTELGIDRRAAPPADREARGCDEPDAAIGEAAARVKVRVKQTSGPRSRSIEVAAVDADAASARALEELGDDWTVLEVEPA